MNLSPWGQAIAALGICLKTLRRINDTKCRYLETVGGDKGEDLL